MKKINIGLDIGVASVGWSIIDENYNIIDLGSRLFNDVADPKDGKLKNESRREARSLRRRIKREQNRKRDLLKFFKNNKLINSEEDFYNKINKQLKDFEVTTISQLKEKMLKEKLNNSALVLVLFNYIHNRGYFYLDDENDSEQKNDKNYEIKKTDDFPSIQLNNFYNKYGFYKGCPLSREFSNEDWKKEIIELLDVQKKDKKFIDEYIDLFTRVRDYSEGPGSEKSPTKYGLWRFNEKNEIEKIGDNLWDITIGKCTIYSDELRGMKNSPKAQLFNLLNDLNNIHFDKKRNKLTTSEKKKYFNELSKDLNKEGFFGKKEIKIKQIAKILDLNYEDIQGIPEDKKITIVNYLNIAKWLIFNDIWKGEKNLLDLELLDISNKIFDEMSKIKDSKKREEKLKELYPKSNNELNSKLISNLKGLSATHSLSYKAMDEYIPIAIVENKNQMEIFNDKLISNRKNKFNKSSKYIPKGLFNDEIISPTSRRAFNQTISIINKIIKKYSKEYQIHHITIEMAREKNTVEQRKSIEKWQKNNRNSLEEVLKRENKNFDDLSPHVRLKIKLWEEQLHKDIYDGKEIHVEEILSNKNLDVDHILPYSVSMDNSQSNKVLTKSVNNSSKSNLTPYQWLSSQGKYEDFKNLVIKTYDEKKYKRKIANLLFESEPIEELQGFIERNLVDTRYASRLVLNTLQGFFNEKETVINVINGSVTNYCRNILTKELPIKKNRDEYSHHAIDASIVAFLGMNSNLSKMAKYENLKKWKKNGDKELTNLETGEVINLELDESFLVKDNSTLKFINSLEKNLDKVKFSRMMLKKENSPLSNETIRTSRKINDKLITIKKLSLIESNINDLDKYFNKNKIEEKLRDNLIIFQNNRYLYDELYKIYNQNLKDGKKNPFITYMEDNFPDIKIINKILLNNQSIKFLKYFSDEKTTDNIILLKEHNNKAFLESLKPLEVRIYKDVNNKLRVISINAKVLDFKENKLIINNEKLNLILKKYEIINFSNYITIHNGTIFINKNNNEIFYSNGGGNFNSNKIEIKPIFTTIENYFLKKNIKKTQWQLSVSTIAKEYDIAEVDILGNIYNRRNIEIN